MERNITIHTGVGGYNLIQEEFERIGLGTERIYMPKKCPRMLKSLFPHKAVTGKFFKRLKIQK